MKRLKRGNVIVTKPRVRWGVTRDYVEKRRVSFMYLIVDKRIFLLSAKFIVRCPYKYKCDWFPKLFRLYFCRISVTLATRVVLLVA